MNKVEHIKQHLKSAGILDAQISEVDWSEEELAYCVDIHKIDTLDAWLKLRNMASEGKYWPVIIDDLETLDRLGEQMDSAHPTSFTAEQQRDWAWVKELPEEWREWADKGNKLSFEGWVAEREAEDPLEDDFMGEWEDLNPSEKYMLEPDILRKGDNQILLLPVENFWEVPAYLRFGNWNDCPKPDVHVSAFKYWSQRFGAQLIGIRFDTIEFVLEKPVKDKEEAIEIAKQQYYYCSDTAPSGLLQAASCLPGVKGWMFWWD